MRTESFAHHRSAFALLTTLALACGGTQPTPVPDDPPLLSCRQGNKADCVVSQPDAGMPDAGVITTPDAGTPDAGEPPDAGEEDVRSLPQAQPFIEERAVHCTGPVDFYGHLNLGLEFPGNEAQAKEGDNGNVNSAGPIRQARLAGDHGVIIPDFLGDVACDFE